MNWTQEEILEYNKRCAEFLGVDVDYSIEVYKDSKSPLRNHIDNKPKSEPLLFDDDWNWIMEVCISLGMEFVTTNKEQLIQQIYDKLRSMETSS